MYKTWDHKIPNPLSKCFIYGYMTAHRFESKTSCHLSIPFPSLLELEPQLVASLVILLGCYQDS